ncbi:hypothetical protein AA958_18985 [Streptomyces sp. CNQ-509]|uniref:hypothetical protein n=1 Tax=Streptomyces sp. CNQ-509 TaxID=444103 RepID=UPI00062DCC38|nr:hypothetical protein [Streptomyces sp. CNQ-509]AKH83933.1 hypothetical protein AA958_18985 [Streptomyces sp. CNQ-509]
MRQKRFPSHALSSPRTGYPGSRRAAIAAAAVAALVALTVAVALLAGGQDVDSGPERAAPALASSPPRAERAPQPAPPSQSGAVPGPPRIGEPVAFAKAAAKMLWSYDTRTTSRTEQLAGMRAWMTTESRYADWASVAGQVPDPLLWSRMADQDQRATASVVEGHLPAAFTQALAEDPTAITEAYVYAVTVTGKQKIAWNKRGGGAEERAVTLAVQCRPGHTCSLAAIAPNVAP